MWSIEMPNKVNFTFSLWSAIAIIMLIYIPCKFINLKYENYKKIFIKMLFLIPNKLILKNTNFQGWPSKNFKPENVGPGYIFFTISSSYFL